GLLWGPGQWREQSGTDTWGRWRAWRTVYANQSPEHLVDLPFNPCLELQYRVATRTESGQSPFSEELCIPPDLIQRLYEIEDMERPEEWWGGAGA
ncbi:unnamed protein product, partial [Discosporangium mesarthrocarpum]